MSQKIPNNFHKAAADAFHRAKPNMNNSYNLNEVLKARKAADQGQRRDNGEVALDDLSRVKVLSPGRQVFKRFIRNRLAVFGSVMLITMFVFSFIGPLFYAYGQKQIFYKYEPREVNYGMVKENTAYTGYDVEGDAIVERAVNNKMNSIIKSMIAEGRQSMLWKGDDSFYVVSRLADDVYLASVCDSEEIATYGSAVTEIGSYSMVGKKIEYAVKNPVEGLEDAVKAAIASDAQGGSFELNGVTYTYARGKAKSYSITAATDGLQYTGEALDECFAAAVEAASANETFEYDGAVYGLAGADGGVARVYRVGDAVPAKVYSRLSFSTYEVGAEVSDGLRVAALLATEAGGSFEAEGRTWTIANEAGEWVVRDEAGAEFMELTPYAVRRYNGDDTMEYGLKKALTEKALQLAASGEKSGSIVYDLPMQTENGEYVYDEEGTLSYQETELTLNQRDTGEFVVNCEQIIYVINMFDAPSGAHLLGTDGDGFDVLARIMYGGRVSLMVGFVVVFLETFLGVIMGGLSGYYGGWVDMLIMRLVDIFYCLPSMPIMIILGALMDAMRMDTYIRLLIMMAALGIMGWAGVARLVRGQILTLREQEFMVATEATGIRVKDRIFHHLVPNIMPQLIVQATMGMGGVILTESTLSFLGLGVKHPLATWGTIINSVSSASAMQHYAFIWIPVGLLICVTVIAFNFVGDGLRDAYDPKAKR